MKNVFKKLRFIHFVRKMKKQGVIIEKIKEQLYFVVPSRNIRLEINDLNCLMCSV